MPRLLLSNASLHYEEYGDGACVAFLHGSGGNHLSWWQQIPDLSQHYRCLTPDLRGFGLSRADIAPCNPAVFADDLLVLLDQLGITRLHLIGQSIGGHYALRFALAHPKRVLSLVLAATLAGIADDGIAAAKAVVGPAPADLFERALGLRFRHERPELTALYRMIERLNHADRAPDTLIPADIARTELANLKPPTLFLVGEHDPVAPPKAVEIAARLAAAKYKMIPDCGHSVYFERPETFNAAVLEFLRGQG